ncbi:MAG: hypothetical protein ACE366_00960 [Bradymonadia bacterium]
MDTPKLFRTVFSAAYWIFTLGIGASIAVSVTSQALSDPPGVPAEVGAPVSQQACIEGFETLRTQLVSRVKEAVTPVKPGDASEEEDQTQWVAWRSWSDGWLVDLATHRRRCPEAFEEATEMVHRLKRLHLAYSTALRGFTAVGRKAMDAVERSIMEARAR